MHLWRTLGPAIPRQVASPQSLLPFHRASQAYYRSYDRFNANTKKRLTNGPYRGKPLPSHQIRPSKKTFVLRSAATSSAPPTCAPRRTLDLTIAELEQIRNTRQPQE